MMLYRTYRSLHLNSWRPSLVHNAKKVDYSPYQKAGIVRTVPRVKYRTRLSTYVAIEIYVRNRRVIEFHRGNFLPPTLANGANQSRSDLLQALLLQAQFAHQTNQH